jgi:WXG100 family type VII secretion target
MAVLHMETDVAKDTQKILVSRHQTVVSEVGAMLSAVNNLRSNWQGNSANQFIQEYEQWNSAMQKMLEELSKISTNLQTEIAEWERTASKFE